MRRQITKKISLVIALFAVIIGLSACGSQGTNSTSTNGAVTSVNYNQNNNVANSKITPTTQNATIPSPQTRQS